MSRIGKNPVEVPKDVKVTIADGSVTLEGSKGKLSIEIPRGIKVEHKEDFLVVTRLSDLKQNRANHGTIRARLKNMMDGIVNGHKKDLEIAGIGFRAQLQGDKLVATLGFSHPVEFDIPKDVTVKIDKQTAISVEGIDKVLVGQVAANIRALKPTEPYKGKGIKYVGEVVRRKQGKSITK